MKPKMIHIDDGLWSQFKAKCALKNKTISQMLTELIQKFVEDVQQKP